MTTTRRAQELARLAGQTAVAAATADPSGDAGQKFALLLGQGDDVKAKLAEQRLARTREQLTGAKGERGEAIRATLEAQWVTRLTDLLEECPGLEADLRALVEEIRAALPAGAVSAPDDVARQAKDVARSVGRGVSARTRAQGGARPLSPIPPRPGDTLAGPWFAAEPARYILPATGGKVAIGRTREQAVPMGRLVRLADPPALLAGRDELLAELNARLTGDNDPGPRVVALSGPAGGGKTCLAQAYAHRHSDEVGLAWQLAADDPVVLAAGLGELAAALGARDVANARDSVALLHEVLAAFPAEWLLIFDNAPDQASVQAFVPPAGRGRVLITSQSHRWPSGQHLEVPALDPESATGFLVDRSGDQDWQAAQDLAGELGGLPLALELAAAYVQATEASLAGYLPSFRQQIGLIESDEPASAPGAAAATWALAFTRLERSAPSAAALLRLLAFCAPAPVPLHMLLQPRPGLAKSLHRRVTRMLKRLLGDPRAAADAVAALRRFSLICPAAGELISVQPLVQALTAEQVPSDLAAAWQQATAAVIEAAVPAAPQRPDTWPEFAALVPHARVVLAADGPSMERIADYLGFSGSYAASRELWWSAAQARAQVLGPDHPDALDARASLAEWGGRAGDAAGARDQYAELVPIREHVCGADHPDTLTDRASLAYWTGKAGDPASARDQYAALRAIRDRVDGPDHPDTLDAADQLARWTGEAGDPAAARDQYAALLAIRAGIDGPDHPGTLDTATQLARWTGEAGDPAAARDQYTALLAIRSRTDGPDHPDTLADRTSLARWASAASDPAQTREQYAALLAIRDKVYGPEHPDTLDTAAQLARWTGEAGDPASARDQYAALLPIRDKVYGQEHPGTLSVRASLAYWTGEAGDPAEARDRYTALLPVLKRILGPEHPETLSIRASLAYWTGEAGDPVGARDRYAAVLPVLRRTRGLEHPETLTIRANLAYWTGEAGDAPGARDRYATLVPMYDRGYGPDHPDTLVIRGSLAYWTGEAGDAASARDQFAALLPIYDKIYGSDHPDTLAARANLANWAGLAGDPAAAREQLPGLQQMQGSDHPATLAARANLADMTGLAGDPAGARDRYATLVPIYDKAYGPDHPDTLETRGSLAYWTGEAGDAASARDQYAALLSLYDRAYGPSHPDTLAVRANLANWAGLAGDPAAAREQHRELLPLLQQVQGHDHPATLAARANLANLTGLAGDPAGARDLYAALLPVIERTQGPDHPVAQSARSNLSHWTRKVREEDLASRGRSKGRTAHSQGRP